MAQDVSTASGGDADTHPVPADNPDPDEPWDPADVRGAGERPRRQPSPARRRTSRDTPAAQRRTARTSERLALQRDSDPEAPGAAPPDAGPADAAPSEPAPPDGQRADAGPGDDQRADPAADAQRTDPASNPAAPNPTAPNTTAPDTTAANKTAATTASDPAASRPGAPPPQPPGPDHQHADQQHTDQRHAPDDPLTHGEVRARAGVVDRPTEIVTASPVIAPSAGAAAAVASDGSALQIDQSAGQGSERGTRADGPPAAKDRKDSGSTNSGDRPAAEPATGGTFRSLRIRNYRLYFTGNVICQTGTWMNRVAQDWLVLQLTNDDPVALGIATALQFGPTLLLSAWAGTIADRVDKRVLLRWIQVVLGAAGVTLGILAWTHAAHIMHVYIACLVVGIAAAFDGPVRQAFVSELVPSRDLTNAVALNSLGFNGARIVGPAIAGVLIAAVDTGPVMTFAGLSYIAVIVSLILINPAELRRSPPAPRRKGQTRDGLRYVQRRPDLMLVMVLVFMVATFGMNFQVTLAIVARIVFGLDADSYGLLSTAIAIGALLGALLSARRSRIPRQRLLLGTALGFGILEAILGFVHSYVLLAILLIPTGMLMLSFVNAANSMVQLTTTPSMRGRVMGIYTLAFLGGAPFYSPLIGVLAEHFGGGAPLVIGGVLSAGAALVLGGWLLRTKDVRFQVRVAPVPHVHLQNAAVDGDDDEHLSESVAHSLQRIGGGARRSVRPAVRAARRARSAGRRIARRPGARRGRR